MMEDYIYRKMRLGWRCLHLERVKLKKNINQKILYLIAQFLVWTYFKVITCNDKPKSMVRTISSAALCLLLIPVNLLALSGIYR